MAYPFPSLAVLAVVLGVFLSPLATAVDLPLQQPKWVELTPPQQQTLAPLAAKWDGLATIRRKQWLEIAARYPTLQPEVQARIQLQMKAWANLSVEERERARANYKSLRMITPEEREALKKKWEEYNKLPEEEKRRLRALAWQRAQFKAAAKKHTPASVHTKPVTKSLKAAAQDAAAIATSQPPVAPPPNSSPPALATPVPSPATPGNPQ